MLSACRKPVAGTNLTGARSARGRRGGQVMVIMLLSLTVLVGLVFYVFNIGDVVNRRLDLQSAADSGAVSGATWMARSMNMVAMNNVGMSRMLASVVAMDSLPLAAEMSTAELTAWTQSADDQLRRGVGDDRAKDIVRQALENLRNRLAAQRDILSPVDQAINRSGFQMSQQTYWAAPGGGSLPGGTLWRAAAGLDDLNAATAQSAGVLSQANATRFGRQGASATFLVPILPRMPARRGSFNDFAPTLVGKEFVTSTSAEFGQSDGPGGAIVDGVWPHRLGPWARQFRWRRDVRKELGWEYVPPTAGWDMQKGGGKVQLGGRKVGVGAATPTSGRGGYLRPILSQIVGYTTYGPYDWMLDQIDWWANDHSGITSDTAWTQEGALPDSQFHSYMRDLGQIKLRYMFPAKVNPPLVSIHKPNWIVDLSTARSLAASGTPVAQTMFYQIEIASKFSETDPRFLTTGTFRSNARRALVVQAPGWQDPESWGVTHVVDHIWKDAYTYLTTQDEEIAILPRTDADGQPIHQTAYMISYYVFGGADIGGDVQVGNPCNWSSVNDLPAPMLLDTAAGDYDPQDPSADAPGRQDRYSFLGVAQAATGAKFWETRFQTPGGAMMAVAQAKLFNNLSWDLWTQDWQVQLTPVSSWDLWRQRLSQGLNDEPAVREFVNLEDLQSALRHMEGLNPQAVEQYMKH